MLTFVQTLKSKTIWVTVAAIIFNGIQAVHPIVDDTTQHQINLALFGGVIAARVANTQGK